MAERSRPFLVPLFPEQMQFLLGLIDCAGITPDREESWLASRTEQALLGGLALAKRYSTPVEEPTP